jgi:hypothetical protein
MARRCQETDSERGRFFSKFIRSNLSGRLPGVTAFTAPARFMVRSYSNKVFIRRTQRGLHQT